eukprot:4532227-Pyramimonas_sp.AAC.3
MHAAMHTLLALFRNLPHPLLQQRPGSISQVNLHPTLNKALTSKGKCLVATRTRPFINFIKKSVCPKG